MNRAAIQSEQYSFPYHYLVDSEHRSIGRRLSWGLEYLAYQEFIARTYLRKGMRLVDVGCGDGFFINRVVPQDIECVGVDYDERAVALAKAMQGEGGKKSFCSALEPEPSFDVCTAIEVLEHIPDDKVASFLDYCVALLKPGGLLIICVPTDVTTVSAKHYRHYHETSLRAHLSHLPGLTWKTSRRVVKNNLSRKLIFALMSNRLWTLNASSVVSRLAAWFNASVLDADAKNGRHLIAVLEKQAGAAASQA